MNLVDQKRKKYEICGPKNVKKIRNLWTKKCKKNEFGGPKT
jgi:hypothetical protein